MADTVAPDAPLPMVATGDVGGAAAAALRARTRLQVEMNRAFSDGSVAARATRTAESTTPTRFEDFAAPELARAFAAFTPAVQ